MYFDDLKKFIVQAITNTYLDKLVYLSMSGTSKLVQYLKARSGSILLKGEALSLVEIL
jgi:hypothetical protein